jgi:Predicted methylated DNA-protein cysteine methyltransferase
VKRKPEPPERLRQRLLRLPPSTERDESFRRIIRQIPKGKVATYSQVAAAAGYPLYHRQVAQLLRKEGNSLPWHRVLGAGGQIKLRKDLAFEQRARLEMEGVQFRGARVDMAAHQHVFRPWELEPDERELPVKTTKQSIRRDSGT